MLLVCQFDSQALVDVPCIEFDRYKCIYADGNSSIAGGFLRDTFSASGQNQKKE